MVRMDHRWVVYAVSMSLVKSTRSSPRSRLPLSTRGRFGPRPGGVEGPAGTVAGVEEVLVTTSPGKVEGVRCLARGSRAGGARCGCVVGSAAALLVAAAAARRGNVPPGIAATVRNAGLR